MQKVNLTAESNTRTVSLQGNLCYVRLMNAVGRNLKSNICLICRSKQETAQVRSSTAISDFTAEMVMGFGTFRIVENVLNSGVSPYCK
jgi:hypothetical protein